ncbi:MAG: alanine racemase [bacterium]|nr:alanine racemase [bacterium]
MKKEYEKPLIQRLKTGLLNKFGAAPYYSRKIRKDIDGVLIQDLVEQYGSPLFVYSERHIRQEVRSLKEQFATRYPKVELAWSYKTNYLKAICALMHQEGSLAEVVSAMEYEKARALGVPGKDIIFNGPHKSRAILKRALEDGAKIHLDHFEELLELESLADELGLRPQVGLRINLDSGIYPQWSRFGFNLESGQAFEAARRMHAKGKLTLDTLHCHIGTYIMEPKAYAQSAEKLVALAKKLKDDLGYQITRLDLGGGFPSMGRLKGQYLPPEVSNASLEGFAEAISTALYANLPPGDLPQLYLESGRALVDEAGFLVTSIVAAKRLPDGRRAYVADAGINLLYTSFWYRFNIELERDIKGANEPSVLYGPLCMNIDVIDEGTQLPGLSKGDRLILSPVGAYNQTQSLQFIEYRPNVVLVRENGQVDLIREAETLEDIERRECLPKDLKLS